MIVRSYLQCETCDAPHMVRVGLGQEPRQTHRFPCRQCGEEICIALVAEAPNAWVEHDENCIPSVPVTNAPIVNLDGNFLIPTSRYFDGGHPCPGRQRRSDRENGCSCHRQTNCREPEDKLVRLLAP